MGQGMKSWLAAMAIAACAVSAAAQTVPPVASVQLQPAGKWAVDYGDWQCRLVREYLAGGKRAILSLELEPLQSFALLKVLVEDGAAPRSDGDALLFADGERRPAATRYSLYSANRFVVREYGLDLDRDRIGEVKGRLRLWTAKAGDI